MWQIMKFHFKGLIRNKILIFWSLIFPLLLATFISLTVSKAYSKQISFDTIKIAVVQSDAIDSDPAFKSVMESVSKGEDALFEVQYLTQSDADQALADDDIIGYITKAESFQMKVKSEGIEQTILHSFVNEFVQKTALVEDMLAHGANYEDIQKAFTETISYRDVAPSSDGDIGYIYFYSILAMTMLYGGYWSMRAMHNQRADHSDLGQRNALAPIPKTKMLWIDFIITVCLQFVVQMIILLYMITILQVDFGNDVQGILLLILVGTIVGNSLGVVICMYGPKEFDAAVGVMTGFTLLSCALAGMMMVDLKYLIDINAPWLAAINPGTMITDAFYAQVYYGMGERYFINLLSLLIVAGICYGFAFMRLRRKQYASL